jgi:hypothetical protein
MPFAPLAPRDSCGASNFETPELHGEALLSGQWCALHLPIDHARVRGSFDRSGATADARSVRDRADV